MATTLTPEPVAVKSGRRRIDWLMVGQEGKSVFFWLFGMFLDVNHKPSMSRCMLAVWTYIGWLLIDHELHLVAGAPSIQNSVWTAWWAAEGSLVLAVFGPTVASYFGSGAAGAITGSALGTAVREKVTEFTSK